MPKKKTKKVKSEPKKAKKVVAKPKEKKAPARAKKVKKWDKQQVVRVQEIEVEYESGKKDILAKVVAKAKEKKAPVKPSKKVKKAVATPKPEVQPEVKVEKKLPVWDKQQVVKVLDGGHNKTHFHCYMANGTTMHVPKHLFK